jgi:hypothetical protein
MPCSFSETDGPVVTVQIDPTTIFVPQPRNLESIPSFDGAAFDRARAEFAQVLSRPYLRLQLQKLVTENSATPLRRVATYC